MFRIITGDTNIEDFPIFHVVYIIAELPLFVRCLKTRHSL